jgi:hypothetical protein
MIGPEEIRKQALKWWKPFLQSQIRGEEFFPKSMDRIGKIQSREVLANLNSLQDQVSQLHHHSKAHQGYGYLIKNTSKVFRRTGAHDLPDSIEFENLDDYIKFIGKKKEWQVFQKTSELIFVQLPQLRDWAYLNPEKLTVFDRDWTGILKVCQYFIQEPRPGMYIRQLPIDVHSKFIEENDALIKSMLNFLIPGHIRDVKNQAFAERFYLKYDEPPRVRLRILDKSLAISNLTDLLIKLSDFRAMGIDCDNIVLTENKMNFLALLEIERTIAIWSGGGFNISYLKGIDWLSQKKIFYWGDLDIQGFHILHQMRSYYPQTKSLLMDQATYKKFEKQAGSGELGNIENLSLLNIEETEIFNLLKAGNLRLEQEKINQQYADAVIKSVIIGKSAF